MRNTDILFAILNYKETANSEALYQTIAPSFACRILDADSGEKPQPFGGDTLYLPNIYFGGLLNKAIELAQAGGYQYLFFLCSDVQILPEQFAKLKAILLQEDFSRVGVYCPSHSKESYTFVKWAYHQDTNKKRAVPCIESMVSMFHKEVFDYLYPCQDNRFGWGVDFCAAYQARAKGLQILIDDRIQLFHPLGGSGKNEAAIQCMQTYIHTKPEAAEISLYAKWIEVYRRNASARPLLCRHYAFWCKLIYKSRKVFPRLIRKVYLFP